MFSWFPILFPLREPIQLKKDDIITLHFWRLVSKEKRPLFFLF
jgi:protein arginine N-methyltransferase 5